MPIKRSQQYYGWRPDLPDWRDKTVVIPTPSEVGALPSVATLVPGMPPIYDQGAAGSCTGNAIARAVDFQRKAQGEPFMTPSRLFIYANERVIEGTLDQDAGAEIRDGIKSIATQGVCPESEWPYDLSKLLVQPTQNCYTDALKFKALTYARVLQTLWGLKYQLAIRKVPVIFGFTVFQSFESDQVEETGIVPMPAPNESPVGGHAVVCSGYDDSKQMFKVENSWGSDWGIAGRFLFPYQYMLNSDLVDDLWELRLVA